MVGMATEQAATDGGHLFAPVYFHIVISDELTRETATEVGLLLQEL